MKVDGSLTLDISYWAEAMRESGMDRVDLILGDAVEFTEGTLRLYDGEQYITPVYTENGTLQFAIPEPTTATLSLLALAALAARRRRR